MTAVIIYILLTLCLTAARNTGPTRSPTWYGDLTINDGEIIKQFELGFKVTYQGHLPRNPENNWVIIYAKTKFDLNWGKMASGKFIFTFQDGVQKVYTTRFQLRDKNAWNFIEHEEVKETPKLRFLECSLTLYEFFVITASFDNRHTVEVIKSKIETKDTKTFNFISITSKMPFTKVRYLTERGKENENSRVTLKILQLFPELISLTVIDKSVGDIFGKTKKWMDKLKWLHLKRVKIKPYVFFDILSKCISLQELTIFGETLSGLGAKYTELGYKIQHDLVVNVDKTVRQEELAVLKKLVRDVEVIDEDTNIVHIFGEV